MVLPQTFLKENKTGIHVVIETPRGSRNKYDYDKENDFFQLKKVLPAGTSFPLDFGFIPHTKGEDGDPLDVLVLMDCPSHMGCVVECRVIGVLEIQQKEKHEKPIRNDRIIAVAVESLCHSDVMTMDDLNDHLVDEIIHFFKYYYEMEKRKMKFLGKKNKNTAMKLIHRQLNDKK
jgi:inorganic pyrophosphatase